MRLLITNDDGVPATGLRVLVEQLLMHGHDVTVAAPITDRSGSASALGVVDDGAEVAVIPVPIDGLEDVTSFGVDAPPAFIVRAACTGAFGPVPDGVISGINPGHNTGRMVLHSGTVGAAMTAVSVGVPGIAVSCGAQPGSRFDTAARVLIGCLGRLVAGPVGALNLNVPDVDIGEVRGILDVGLADEGSTEIELARHGDGIRVRRRAGIAADDADGDTVFVRRGYATLSTVVFGAVRQSGGR
jgi:5'-nucleotidase